MAGPIAVFRAHIEARFVGSRQERTGVNKESFASQSQPGRPPCPLKQHHAQLLFEIPDRTRQGRLLDADAIGCALEVQFLGDRDKMPEMTKLHSPCLHPRDVKQVSAFRRRDPDAVGCRQPTALDANS
nr:hypothetical protein [Nitrobacter sp. 62-23]